MGVSEVYNTQGHNYESPLSNLAAMRSPSKSRVRAAAKAGTLLFLQILSERNELQDYDENTEHGLVYISIRLRNGRL